jgi:ATP-binding cassette, subfamily C, bacterial CydC
MQNQKSAPRCSHARPSPASALHIRALSFRYLPDLPYALQDIDFDLPTGKRIALVGPSGAGKTTLANLLLRLWDYSEGEIRLGGCDLRQLDPQVVRQRFGVVSQRTYLFGGTLRDNLLLARPDARKSKCGRLCARPGCSRGFRVCLPRWIPGLASAACRSALASASAWLWRAVFYRMRQYCCWMSLPQTWMLIPKSTCWYPLSTLMKDRSVLWITHRLVGMEAVDEIIVLDGGCIVQRGRHKDLLQQPGLYQRMWTLQNRIILDR